MKTQLYLPNRPALSASLAHKSRDLLQVIDAFLSQSIPLLKHPSLMSGQAGLALFKAYFGWLLQAKTQQQEAQQLLGEALHSLSTMPLSGDLCSGISGILFTLAHLGRAGLIAADVAQMIAPIQPSLQQNTLQQFQVGNVELLYGGIGQSLYEFELPRSVQNHALIANCLSALQTQAVPQSEGWVWYSRMHVDADSSQQVPQEWELNLGISHGMVALLPWLTICLEQGVKAPALVDTLQRAITGLLQLSQDSSASVFPYAIRAEHRPEPTRLAWCYGDLSNALVLWHAAHRIHDLSGMEGAREIAEQCARRIDEIRDISALGICHGCFGVAHLFSRLAFNMGGESLEQAAQKAYLIAIEKLDAQKGELFSGGLMADAPDEETLGLLEGVAGIGLVIISQLYPHASAWDRCFLLQ